MVKVLDLLLMGWEITCTNFRRLLVKNIETRNCI